MGTDGGTELLPALKHVNEAMAQHSKNKDRKIVLITDGQVGNEAQVQSLAGTLANIPIYCFGIDHAVNDALLRNLASKTNGRCALMTPHDDIAGAVAKLALTLRQPVLVKLELGGAWKAANPQARFPELCAGETSVVALRCEKAEPRVAVTGTQADGQPWHAAFELQADDSCAAPRLAWAKQRVDQLLAENDDTAAVELATEHNILCKGATFVAIDEAEKVPVAQRMVYQPAAAPMAGGKMRCMSLAEPPSYIAKAALYCPQEDLDPVEEIYLHARKLPDFSSEAASRRHAQSVAASFRDHFKYKLDEIEKIAIRLRQWFIKDHTLPEWIADALVQIIRDWMLAAEMDRSGFVSRWMKIKTPAHGAEFLQKFFDDKLTYDHRDKALVLLKDAVKIRAELEGSS
jgi:hypothetical protein